MKVILLCAGYAVRLYPLTKDQPKPLLPVAGTPILEYILQSLKGLPAIDTIYIVTNHKFTPHFEKWAGQKKESYAWPLAVVDDKTTSNENRLGAIGDLQYVLKTNRITRDDLLVVAGDNIFDFDLCEFVEVADKKRPHAVIAVYDVENKELARKYGLVQISAGGQVTDFFEKPENPPTTLASCGIYWLPGETLDLLDRYLGESHNADQPGHYMRWLAEKDKLFAIPLKGRWYDIGDLNSYQKAGAEFAAVRQGKNQNPR